jgi:hypothetical protein
MNRFFVRESGAMKTSILVWRVRWSGVWQRC